MNLSRRHFLARTALGTGAIALNSTVGLEDSELLEQKNMNPQAISPPDHKVTVEGIHLRQTKIQNGQSAITTDSTETIASSMDYNGTRGDYSQLDTVNNVITLSSAMVLPEKEITISAGIQGTLTRLRVNAKDRNGADILDAEGKPVKIEVKEGQNVSKDQEIGTIDDSIELKQIAAANALLNVAIAEEGKTIEIEFARAAWTVAIAAVARNEEANRLTPGMIAEQQALEDRLKKVQAEKQYEKALYDLNIIRPAETNVKRQELAIAETRLGQRRLVSSVDGIVEEIYGHEGMWFREGEKILKITQYDTLKVKGKVNVQHATPRMINGKSVEVIAKPLGKELPLAFTGKVIFASQTIEGDGCFNIHVEVKNQLKDGYWLLNPGRFVELRIKL